MSKYTISLECDNLDTFIVVMKVVDNNVGIKVTEAGLPLFKRSHKTHRKSASPHKNPNGTAPDLFMEHIKGKGLNTVTNQFAKQWFKQNKYGTSTHSVAIHHLVKDKRLKLVSKGVYSVA